MWLLAPFSFQLSGMDFVWLATKVLLNQWYTAQYLRKKVEVAQLCLNLCNLRDYTVHGILQARIQEWVAFPFSRGFSQPESNPGLLWKYPIFYIIYLLIRSWILWAQKLIYIHHLSA